MAVSNMGTDSSPVSSTSLAVLIDADNTPPKIVDGLFEEIAKFGTASVKRIYGDWTLPNLRGWKDGLAVHAIQPIQQFRYTVGKNATDSAMIIDAMDILYSAKVDGFCIVSSDSDFTRLATRLRESGMRVIGMGEKKTPEPFIVACDRFIFIEILKKPQPAKKKASNGEPEKAKRNRVPAKIKQLIAASIDDLSDDDGWAFLGEVGSLLLKKQPQFDPRNYGFNKLTPLLKSLRTMIEIDERQSPGRGHSRHIYARLKKRPK